MPEAAEPKPAETAQKPPDSGRVVHDARGNAVWDFAIATGVFALESTSRLLQRLESSNLSIDESPKISVEDDKSGGYDPYNRRSGRR